ncbi:MAG: metallophosphoesterase, partial [Thermodesulfobacteriota bacterium]|nr:metallophosphoesterase [Thermodesulfobacteriota bacterium]
MKSKCCFYLILFVLLAAQPLSAADGKVITIVHTNDLHSHLLGFSPNIDYTPLETGDDKTVGGWARIATVIQDVKQDRSNPVLVVDAGDFLMGSLFHMLSREEAFELRLMKAMGYDVVTLGNHEFDLKPAGLARILTANQQ